MKIATGLGRSVGVAGALFTAIEGARDGNGITWGDGVKVGIGLLTTFTPIGWAYGLIDITVGIITDTTMTDRIGTIVDEEIAFFIWAAHLKSIIQKIEVYLKDADQKLTWTFFNK